MIMLLATLSQLFQAETPSQALAKIQETVVKANAFSVRVDVGIRPGDSSVKVHLACARENKLRLELQMTKEKESETNSSLMVSDGTMVVTKGHGLRKESKAETYLANSWASALMSGGILPSVYFAIGIGESLATQGSSIDFRKIVETKEASFGKQEGSLREIKYVVLYTQLVDQEKRILMRYNVSLTYDIRTYLPTERSVVDPNDQTKSFYEQYKEWLFGDNVKTDLFIPPKS